MLAYVLSFVIRLALSRSREFLADAGSVELTKNPDAMISALRKIESRGELPGATSAVMEMCVDNPRQGFGELFDTHPSVESRVAALVDSAGGHDPGPHRVAAATRRGGYRGRWRNGAAGTVVGAAGERQRGSPWAAHKTVLGVRRPARRRVTRSGAEGGRATQITARSLGAARHALTSLRAR